MLIADPGDLNPAMIVRWQSYFSKLKESKRKQPRSDSPQLSSSLSEAMSIHPVWGPWFALSSLTPSQFSDVVAATCEQEQTWKSAEINETVARTLRGSKPPESVAELANRYGQLMKSVHDKWQTRLKESIVRKQPMPSSFENLDEEQIRYELYGPLAPASIPEVFGWGFLTLLPDRASQAEFQKLLKEVEQWLFKGPEAPPRAMVLNDTQPFEPRIFLRGNPNRLGEPVQRQFLSALASEHRPFEKGSGRLELAQAIASANNPLTGRVIVNRIWLHHFGVGLHRTPGDFGLRSDPPTHPELLDWLTNELMRTSNGSNRWSLKRIHRLILSSHIYRQSSHISEGTSFDPENRGLTHFNRRRLDFEATRDALVWVSGNHDDRIGGPSQTMLDGGFHPRRTVYAFVDRLDPPGLLSTFDFPSPAATSPARDLTTVSPQALFLMNSPLTLKVAEQIANQLEFGVSSNFELRTKDLFRLIFSRDPSEEELSLTKNYLGPSPSVELYQQFIHALLFTNEFVFVD